MDYLREVKSKLGDDLELRILKLAQNAMLPVTTPTILQNKEELGPTGFPMQKSDAPDAPKAETNLDLDMEKESNIAPLKKMEMDLQQLHPGKRIVWTNKGPRVSAGEGNTLRVNPYAPDSPYMTTTKNQQYSFHTPPDARRRQAPSQQATAQATQNALNFKPQSQPAPQVSMQPKTQTAKPAPVSTAGSTTSNTLGAPTVKAKLPNNVLLGNSAGKSKGLPPKYNLADNPGFGQTGMSIKERLEQAVFKGGRPESKLSVSPTQIQQTGIGSPDFKAQSQATGPSGFEASQIPMEYRNREEFDAANARQEYLTGAKTDAKYDEDSFRQARESNVANTPRGEQVYMRQDTMDQAYNNAAQSIGMKNLHDKWTQGTATPEEIEQVQSFLTQGGQLPQGQQQGSIQGPSGETPPTSNDPFGDYVFEMGQQGQSLPMPGQDQIMEDAAPLLGGAVGGAAGDLAANTAAGASGGFGGGGSGGSGSGGGEDEGIMVEPPPPTTDQLDANTEPKPFEGTPEEIVDALKGKIKADWMPERYEEPQEPSEEDLYGEPEKQTYTATPYETIGMYETGAQPQLSYNKFNEARSRMKRQADKARAEQEALVQQTPQGETPPVDKKDFDDFGNRDADFIEGFTLDPDPRTGGDRFSQNQNNFVPLDAREKVPGKTGKTDYAKFYTENVDALAELDAANDLDSSLAEKGDQQASNLATALSEIDDVDEIKGIAEAARANGYEDLASQTERYAEIIEDQGFKSYGQATAEEKAAINDELYESLRYSEVVNPNMISPQIAENMSSASVQKLASKLDKKELGEFKNKVIKWREQGKISRKALKNFERNIQEVSRNGGNINPRFQTNDEFFESIPMQDKYLKFGETSAAARKQARSQASRDLLKHMQRMDGRSRKYALQKFNALDEAGLLSDEENLHIKDFLDNHTIKLSTNKRYPTQDMISAREWKEMDAMDRLDYYNTYRNKSDKEGNDLALNLEARIKGWESNPESGLSKGYAERFKKDFTKLKKWSEQQKAAQEGNPEAQDQIANLLGLAASGVKSDAAGDQKQGEGGMMDMLGDPQNLIGLLLVLAALGILG